MNKLENILLELHPDVNFMEETGLISNGILDSFDIISLVSEIDAEYGVTIPVEELVPKNFDSLEAISSLINRLMEV